MVIPNNNKFSAVVFHQATSRIKERMVVNDIIVLPNFTLGIGSHWEKWLGTLRAEEILKSNLILITKEPSSKPNILDDENENLNQKIQMCLYSLLLSGVPGYSHLNMLTGANIDGYISIRQVIDMHHFYVVRKKDYLYVTEDVIKESYRLCKALENIFSETDKYKRLRRGFTAFICSMREDNNYNRMHQLVRALEALILPEAGRTKNQFKHRCQLFAKASPQADAILGEIYEIRSRIEHLREWYDLYPMLSKEEIVEMVDLRIRQAEALLRHSYKHIITQDQLLNFFEDDTSLRLFWKLSDKDKFVHWPNRLELERIE